MEKERSGYVTVRTRKTKKKKIDRVLRSETIQLFPSDQRFMPRVLLLVIPPTSSFSRHYNYNQKGEGGVGTLFLG
jgi:hypothetical protein